MKCGICHNLESGCLVLKLPKAHLAPVLSRELLYNGMTRARDRLTLIGENVGKEST